MKRPGEIRLCTAKARLQLDAVEYCVTLFERMKFNRHWRFIVNFCRETEQQGNGEYQQQQKTLVIIMKKKIRQQ